MFRQRIIWVILLVLVSITISFSAARGASNDSFRLSQLESEISNLRATVSRLEYQLSGSRPSLTVPQRSVPSQARRQARQLYSQDPMFDRLATLAVELKERVQKVETRLSRVEARVLPKS